MDISDYFRFLIALVFVLGLIGLIAVLLRQFGYGGAMRLGRQLRGARARLGVVEVAALDARRRLVLVRRDDREHLLLLGPERDLVVESDIPARRVTPSEPAGSPEGEDAAAAKPRFAGMIAAFRGEDRT